MKKSLILLTVLLLAGALAFAEDVTPTWAITGSAYAAIGYDLNVEAGGITNSQSFDFKFSYFPKATYSKGGEGLYGMIEVKDVQFSFINATWDKVNPLPGTQDADYYSVSTADDVKNDAGTITAKVVYAPFYLLVSKGLDDMRFNYSDNPDGYSDVNFYHLADLYTTDHFGTMAIGYSSDIFSARLTALSNGDYATILLENAVDKTDPYYYKALTTRMFVAGLANAAKVDARTANTSGDWAFGLWLAVNPMAMLSVDAKAFLDTYQDILGFGGKITLKPIDLISVTFGADAYNNLADLFYIDLKPALTVNLGDDALTASLYYSNYPYVAAVPGTEQTESEIDASIKFVEADGDAGYVPGLGASVEFKLDNLAPLDPAEMGWTADVKANYTMGGWKPYAQFKMSPNTPNTDQMIKVNAGVVFTGIANTEITLDFNATDMTKVEAIPGGSNAGNNEKGIIYLKTKISY